MSNKRNKRKHAKELKRKLHRKNLAQKNAQKKILAKKGLEFDYQNKSMWKHTTDKQKPFFNISWLGDMGEETFHNLYESKLPVTEEMIEWFILTIKDIDPLNLEKGSHHLSDSYTREHLEFMFCWLMGWGDGKFKTKKREWFAKHINKINNKKMRLLASRMLLLKGSDFVDFDDMKKCAKGLTNKEKIILSNWRGFESQIMQDWKEYDAILEGMKYTNDEYLYFYRTFKVEDKQSVRKGLKKKGWFGGLNSTQNCGRGVSYSVSKASAILIASWLHKSTAKSFGVSESQLEEYFREQNWMDVYEELKQLKDGVYCAIGTFRAKKKDIIGFSDAGQEEEVIVHPKDVELMDYRFLNHLDFMTATTVCDLGLAIGASHFGDVVFKRSSLTNRDIWFDAIRLILEQYPHKLKVNWMKRHVIQKRLQDGKTLNLLMKWVAQKIYGLNDPQLVYYDRKTKKQTLVSMGFVENGVEDKIYMMNSNIFSERPVARKSLLESSIHKGIERNEYANNKDKYKDEVFYDPTHRGVLVNQNVGLVNV